MNSSFDPNTRLLRRIRGMTILFIIGLLLSGATAIPLESELNWLAGFLPADANSPSVLSRWIARVQTGLGDTNGKYPFMAYGTDWLAFGHFMIAIVFIWAWREPVRNRWIFDFGLIACALVIPYALTMGAVRGIPIGWRLIDCCFGLFGAVPLWLCRRWARALENSAGKVPSPRPRFTQDAE